MRKHNKLIIPPPDLGLYQTILQKLGETLIKEEQGLKNSFLNTVDAVCEELVESGERTREDIERVTDEVTQDILESVHECVETGETLKSLIEFDVGLMNEALWDYFSVIADKAKLEWATLEQELKISANNKNKQNNDKKK